ncbi:MAG: phage tail spike protein, partial [Clostridium perfringens]|nr:phage tail spike protein [Clostridium perfringens]
MLQLHDKNKRKIAGLVNYENLCIESVLSTGYKTLSFSYPKSSKYYEEIVEEGYVRTKKDEFVIKSRDICEDYTKFECILNLDDLEGIIFDRFESVEQTITASLNLAIVGTRWTVKDNTLKKKRTVRCTNKNALEIIQDIKKTYRVDIVFNTLEKRIEVYEHLGEDKGTYFIDSLNLTALQVQSDSYNFATRLVAEGKDGLTFEDINNGKNYVENYQYSKKVKTLYWKDERYTIKESLLEDAKAKLKEISKPFTSYNVNILNLAELNPKYKNILDYQLGDIITLLSKNNKLRDKQRIVKTIEWPQDHTKDSVELANAILKFEDIQQENQETTDTVNNITTDNGTINGSTIDSITTKQIEDFKANVIQVTNLHALNADIDYLKVNKADMQDVNIVKAKIGTLETTKASITELTALKSKLQQAIIVKADITDVNAANGKIAILESKTASIDNLLSQKASINDLNALNTTISEALIKKATIAQLETLETKTNNLIADKANITDLNVANANINKIQAETASIKTLLNGNLSSENIQAGGITSDKLTIANGFITNLMISSVSASKITAGTIDAAKINVVNLNADNLTVGKINGQLLKDGSISGLAIENGAIDNNKVSPNANIEASKINISSVVTAINEGSTLLTANKVTIDSEKGTLDVAFNNLNTSLEANKKITESNSTAINVVQGKLSASIENSKVLEGKQKTLEDNYNRTVITVDSLKNTVGQQKTLIDSATGKITSVEVKANTLEKNLSGLTQTVTDTKKVIENNKTILESKNAELKANIDKVSSSLSSVSSTVDKNNKTLLSKTNTLEQTLFGLTQTVSSNKATTDGKISSVENVTHELKAGLGGLTSKLDTLKSTTDGINKTVSNQGSVINQLKDSIKLKVDSSTFTQSTQTINSNINKAKEDAINTANNNTTNAINRINIGGRNLALNSSRFELPVRNTGTASDNYNYISIDANLLLNSEYTISANVEIVSGSIKEISIYDYPGGKCSRVPIINNRITYTFTKRSNTVNSVLLYAGLAGETRGNSVVFTNVMLEKGNKVTDWTPAPEDLQAYANEIAKAKAELAQANAIANADGKITEEERKRIQQAEANLNVAIARADKAKVDAKAYSDLLGQQLKANAEKYANDVAIAKSELVKQESKAYADGIVTEEEKRRIAEAKKNLDAAISKSVEAETKAKSYADVKKQEAINIANNNISSAIDNLKIGGRNLAQLTEPKEYSSFTGRVNDCQIGYEILLDTLNVGDPVTVSYTFSYENLVPVNNHSDYGIWLQGCGDVTEWNSGGFPGGSRLTPKINWGTGHSGSFKVEYTFKLEANAKKNKKWFTSFRMDYIQSGKVSVKEFMVEYGTKANAYIQAPEDLKVYVDKVAKAKADLAQANAIANADGKITVEEKKRIQQAQENLNIAIAKADKAKADSQAYSDALGKQLKANAEKYANDVAIAKSELVKQESKAYADGIVTAEEKKRIDEARKNLDTAIAKATEAETKAKSYADSKKQEAIKAAENLALEKSNLAKKYADEVATAKANLAKEQAIASADGKISAEEKKRIQQAQENLNTAISKADKAKQDAINEANRVAELKKQEAINSANSHADSKANEALNNAKAYTNTEITTVNTHLNQATSEINVLKGQISSKVSQSDVDNTVIKYKTQNYGYLYKKDIVIYGDYNLYYPVVIKGGDQNVKRKIFIKRGYAEQGPSEWNPSLSTHHGGLNLLISTNFGGWGGINYSWSIYDLEEQYSRMFAGATLCASGMAFAIFLRGGGEKGAIYHLYSDQSLEGYIGWEKEDVTKPPALQIAYNKDMIGFYKPAYEFYAPGPRIITKEVEEEIKRKKFIELAQSNTNEIIETNKKITTVESTLTQENNSIKASVRDLNSTTQSITTNVSNINRDLTSKINSNLDVAKNFATDIAIAKANLAKEQAIASADGKITAEEKKRIQQAQTNLNTAIAKATEAETKAKSYADSKKQEAINSANNAINNIKIGGRNYGLNTDVMQQEPYNIIFSKDLVFEKGKTYTISMDFDLENLVKGSQERVGCEGSILFKDGTRQYIGLWHWISQGATFKGRKSYTFTIENKDIKDNMTSIHIYTELVSSGKRNLGRFKIEEGNKATDYTIAPEDLQSYADKVAKAKADLAQANAIANADGKITEEERKRIQQAQENLNTAIARADKAKQDAINAASTDATNKTNNALNSAKAYVNAEITTVNTKINNVESNINILKNKIESKVGQSDIDKSISAIKIGGRNLVQQSISKEYTGFSGRDNDCQFNYEVLLDTLNVGDTITVSFLFSYENLTLASNTGYGFRIQGSGDVVGWSDGAFPSFSFTDKIKFGPGKSGSFRVEYNYVLTSNSKKNTKWYPNIRTDKIQSGKMAIKEFMVEFGTKRTAYLPAPEDTDKLVADSIKVVDTKISDVSSKITQLKDSVTIDINSINSKTHAIETNLGGKASKQEVTEVNNRVATIKASLDSITQRVSSTESKTNSLETTVNGKASKQELTVVNNKVTEVTANLNGITQRVGNTESRINNLDGKLANTVTNQQFTEFKQSNDKFKFTVEQRSSVSNILPNSSFFGGDRGWLHNGAEFWSGPYSGYGFKGRMTGAIKNRAGYNNPERFLQTHKAYKVKKNTTYTISFHYACEMNIQSMEAYVVLSDTEHGDYAQPIRILEKPGGTQSDPNNEIPFTYKFNTGNHEWVWLRFDHNGMKPGTNWDQYCWLYVSEIGIYEGDVGAVKWIPKGGEVYSANYQMDGLGFKGTFEDGTYASLGK